MATPQGSVRAPSRSPHKVLHATIEAGDVAAVMALLATDPIQQSSLRQAGSILKSCAVAPNAIELFESVLHSNVLQKFRRDFHFTTLSFLYACEHGAEPATVSHIEKAIVGGNASRPHLRKGLVLAMEKHHFPIVQYILDTYPVKDSVNYDKLLTAAIDSKDEAFALRFIAIASVQTFLTAHEASTMPLYIPSMADVESQGVDEDDFDIWIMIKYSGRLRSWVAQGLAHEMRQVIEALALQCPNLVGQAMLILCATANVPGDVKQWSCFGRFCSINQRIKAFHDAVVAGNGPTVKAMLDAEPTLFHSNETCNVSAVMTSSVAPNAIALLDCLREHGATRHDAIDAFVHACANGGEVEVVSHLWHWIAAAAAEPHPSALRSGLVAATKSQNLAVVSYLLLQDSGPSIENTKTLPSLAIASRNEFFALAVMELLRMSAFFGTGSTEVCMWLKEAIANDMRKVVEFVDELYPDQTRTYVFLHCYNKPRKTVEMWWDLRQRYVCDVTWEHAKGAHLVQRRRLPGLDPLGAHIASYLFVFSERKARCYFSIHKALAMSVLDVVPPMPRSDDTEESEFSESEDESMDSEEWSDDEYMAWMSTGSQYEP